MGAHDRDQLVVGMQRLGRLAGTDVDRRDGRDERTRTEHCIDEREQRREQRDVPEDLAPGQQIEDATGGEAVESVRAAAGAEFVFESDDRFVESGHERCLDHVIEHDVAVTFDGFESSSVIGHVRTFLPGRRAGAMQCRRMAIERTAINRLRRRRDERCRAA